MPSFNKRDKYIIRQQLQLAVINCSERCLYQSAKWSAEMLDALEDGLPTTENGNGTLSEEDMLPLPSTQSDPEEAIRERRELSKYLLAKSYFECREYDRCTTVFLPMTLPRGEIGPGKAKHSSKDMDTTIHTTRMADGAPNLSQKALFISLYARYLAGEKRKDEENETIMGAADGSLTTNRELVGIQQQLNARFAIQDKRGEDGQGWLEYLYGIVLAKQKNTKDAEDWFVKSINMYQWNWAAWQELGYLIDSVEKLEDIQARLPQGIPGFIFNIYMNQSLFQLEGSILDGLKDLKSLFPDSHFLRTQKALIYYHAKHYEKAERTFAKILQRDPLRLDSLEVYSNILFVMDKTARLAFIAQVATSTDRFRPETCIAVGNYFSKRSEHEKAIVYFRRALTLDRSYEAAWTLMGHEYLELHNTHAAIESYRRAIDINRKDFRAWYGLGQTYEMLEMHLYALYYFQRAAALCSTDPKIWQAMGHCLDKLSRWHQAIKSYKRALAAGSGRSALEGGLLNQTSRPRNLDPDITHAIALDYDKLNDTEEVIAWLELTLAQEDGIQERREAEGASFLGASQMSTRTLPNDDEEEIVGGTGVTATTSRARLWLARLEFVRATPASYKTAMILANELCNHGYEVEEAKGLLKEIRGKMGEQWASQVDREIERAWAKA